LYSIKTVYYLKIVGNNFSITIKDCLCRDTKLLISKANDQRSKSTRRRTLFAYRSLAQLRSYLFSFTRGYILRQNDLSYCCARASRNSKIAWFELLKNCPSPIPSRGRNTVFRASITYGKCTPSLSCADSSVWKLERIDPIRYYIIGTRQ